MFFLHGIRRHVSFKIHQLQPQNIINMCCGTGNQLKYFNKISNCELAGIDISDNMLAIASKRKLNCFHMDATNTKFTNNTYDVAIMSFVLHETSYLNAMKIAAKAKRIVKHNGSIVIVDYVFDDNTNLFGKAAVNLVEFLMGKVHFGNFKAYLKYDYLKSYTLDLKMLSKKKHLLGAVNVNFYNNNNKKLSL